MRFYYVALAVAVTLLSTTNALTESATQETKMAASDYELNGKRSLRTVDTTEEDLIDVEDEERGAALEKLREILHKVKREVRYQLAITPEAKETIKFNEWLRAGANPDSVKPLLLNKPDTLKRFRIFYDQKIKKTGTGAATSEFHLSI